MLISTHHNFLNYNQLGQITRSHIKSMALLFITKHILVSRIRGKCFITRTKIDNSYESSNNCLKNRMFDGLQNPIQHSPYHMPAMNRFAMYHGIYISLSSSKQIAKIVKTLISFDLSTDNICLFSFLLDLPSKWKFSINCTFFGGFSCCISLHVDICLFFSLLRLTTISIFPNVFRKLSLRYRQLEHWHRCSLVYSFINPKMHCVTRLSAGCDIDYAKQGVIKNLLGLPAIFRVVFWWSKISLITSRLMASNIMVTHCNILQFISTHALFIPLHLIEADRTITITSHVKLAK